MLFIDSVCYDVACRFQSVSALTQDVISITQSSWANGADVVVLPEYLWMSILQYRTPYYGVEDVAEIFWRDVWPELKSSLSVADKAVVLGSVPRVENGRVYNTAPVLVDGAVVFQDKLALTPWEAQFTGGQNLNCFFVKGRKCAVNICLDIEMPVLGQMLKQACVDVVLVPSATETEMGAERIARCASARAVELGSVVVTSAICGEIENDDFLGANFGRMACYMPALSGLESVVRSVETPIQTAQTKVTRFEIPDMVFDIARNEINTTNPSQIFIDQPISLQEMRGAA